MNEVRQTEHQADEHRFVADVWQNPNNAQILQRWDQLALPDGWLVAGCLFQTVWNLRSGRAPEADIKDYDLFYFDADDCSEDSEKALQLRAEALFNDLGIQLEVCNQARVHEWYPAHFGRPYPRLNSARDGIDRFLVPATCVGIRPSEVYAPDGFERLYAGQLSMNPLTPFADLYDLKAASYQQRWPWLTRV